MGKIDESRQRQLKTIKEYHTAVIAGINLCLDKIYNLRDSSFDENGNLKEGLTREETLENYIHNLINDSKKYEMLRTKLVEKNFGSLSDYEIQLCALIMLFVRETFSKQIADLDKSIKIADNIIKSIMKTVDKDEESNS